ncbi:deoxynucleotide monophosphate kinase family protein [Streptomyces nigrescens]
MHHIALIGKARSGKDTVARHLIRTRQYTRVAFADPLKPMALDINPIVDVRREWNALHRVRLAEIVQEDGWERAKDLYPEVRRVLQHVGQTVRELDPDFWVNLAMDKIDAADTWNLPVVVTDVRYLNEVIALQNRGFTVVRVLRPNAGLSGENGQHDSETRLDEYKTRRTLLNIGTLDYLNAEVDRLFTEK